MALSTKLGSEVPEGALVVSKEEALDYQKSIIRDWPTLTDVQVTKFFLKYGFHVTFGATLVSSAVIYDHFRRKLTLGRVGYLLLTAPGTLIPSYTSGLLAERVVTNNSLLMKIKCPICTQLKFALGQAYFGVAFPALFGVSSFLLMSEITKTYPLTKKRLDPKGYWKDVYNFLKSGVRSYQISGIIHAVLLLALPYMQAKELLKVSKTLREESDDEVAEK